MGANINVGVGIFKTVERMIGWLRYGCNTTNRALLNFE